MSKKSNKKVGVGFGVGTIQEEKENIQFFQKIKFISNLDDLSHENSLKNK